jgi:hypothetical protein
MNQDLNELKDLVAEIRADHVAQKEKEKRDAWTKFVSLTMICLAVLTGIGTQKGGGFSTATMKQLNEATFQQANASDQWAFFQAKGIKQGLVEREMEHESDPTLKASLAVKVAKYDAEKKKISDDAKAFEARRDAAKLEASQAADRGRRMGLSLTLFQIAIAFGGMCLVVKKRWLWYGSLAVGTVATVQMLSVLLLG